MFYDALGDGQWHHVVVMRDEGGIERLYIDGVLQKEDA